MKRLLLLLFLGFIVVAQTDTQFGDTSNEEALLDELLSENIAENQLPSGDAPEITYEPQQAEPAAERPQITEPTYEPVETYEPEEQQGNTTQYEEEGQYSTPSVPEETRSTATRADPPVSVPDNQVTPTYSASPELTEEAKVQETPEIPLFKHKAHIEDVGAECVQCHQTLFAESVRGIKTGPSMKEICSQCHNGEDARAEVLAGFSDKKKYVKTHLPLFSHTEHIQHTEECTVCHTDIYHEKMKQIEIPPPMNRCANCHNDYKANSSCRSCHENPEQLQPKSHTSRWLYRNGHGKEARLNQNECRSCHTERQCTACHRGQTSFDVHRPGYKFSHGMDARQRTVNCGYCHDANFSCAQCHERKQ